MLPHLPKIFGSLWIWELWVWVFIFIYFLWTWELPAVQAVVSLTAFSFTCPEKIFSVEALTWCPAQPSPACSLPCLVSTCPTALASALCHSQNETSSRLSLTRYYSSGVWQVCLIISACSSSFLYYQSHLQPCPIGGPVSLPRDIALKNNHDLPAVPLMESAEAGEGVSCITVTSCSQLPVCWASNSAFQKTLIKKKGPFFPPDCCKWKSFSLGSCGSYLWKWREQLQYLWQLQKRLNLYFIDMYLRAHKNLIAH